MITCISTIVTKFCRTIPAADWDDVVCYIYIIQQKKVLLLKAKI